MAGLRLICLIVFAWVAATAQAADVASADGFTFEDDKTLLFTIRSNIGEDPQKAFITRGNGNRPAPSPNEPLPAVYRSDLLDDLPGAVRRLGKKNIVAEMRVDRAAVMRVVFDIGDYTDTVDQFNWFSPSRLVGAWPYKLEDAAKFFKFSVKGDVSLSRSFLIAISNEGCERDRGFWFLSGARDPCGWGHKAWKGLAPVLVYNRFKDRTMQQGAAFADQFLVYLTDTVDEFRAEFRTPFFHAERKQLLYTIKANIHKSVLETFTEQQNYRSPIDDKLPVLYRSDLLDDLPRTVKDSGMTQMVVELVKADSVVAQVVFNVSKNTDSLNIENWFSTDRLESSYPYLIDKSKFNFFSLEGDKTVQRRFYISYNYGGCENDAGFIAISDSHDTCDWARRYWRGSPPLLLYNRLQSRPFHQGVDSADRMLVYLTHEVEDRRWDYKRPFVVDDDKQILFTITSRVGKEALDTFKHQQDYPIPDDRSLPLIYRSDLLDQLAKTVERSGRKKMIAEMRKDNDVVARLVFDVSTDTDSLTLTNWFSRDRLESAYPYQISKKVHLNYFSIDGDKSMSRNFAVTDTGKGCDNDLGFWLVSDKKDQCSWGSEGWLGAAPVLLYNRYRTTTFRSGVDYADRFVIYLTNTVDVLRKEFKKPIEFERDKQLLFTIVPNVHMEAHDTFEHQQNFKMPADGSLPPVYRSDLLDELPWAVKQSGKKNIVVEMRKDNQVVSQVVFDVSTDTEKLTKENWFSRQRLESTYPYSVDRSEFNFFSIDGDVGAKRRFFISHRYPGCEKDAGFIVVADAKDGCNWISRGWQGSAPILIYNREQGRPFHETAGYADRLIIYLAKEMPDLREEFKRPLIVDGNKQVLFTITSNIQTEAVQTFYSPQNYKAPADGSLPRVYRSDLLDQLALTVKKTGKTKMVGEMIKNDQVVAQMVFDLSDNTDEITLKNWFSHSRLVSSYPFRIEAKQRFDHFTIDGDPNQKRGFFVAFSGGGCDNDRGFWMISDRRDACSWANEGWKGSAPVLIYNRYRTTTFRSGVDYADRYLLYLTDSVKDLRVEFNQRIIIESGKQLLFTIVPNVHLEALETFEYQQNFKMPTDGALPPVYRSDLVDELPRAVKESGMKKMILEMRKDDQVVSQVVFDVSTDTDKLNKENWFSLLRLESSYPYPISRKEFNYFSLDGEVGQKRRFFISNNYGGCERDAGFIMVSDYQGHCDWVTRGWRGSAPTLVYNREQGRPFHESAGYADRMLIYLSNEFNDPRAEFKKFIVFEEYKQLLFTIEANIGREALNVFAHRQDFKMPTDGSLPPVYRSDLLDQLALTVKQSGKSRMVAEMREGNSVVSQVIFNVARDTDKLTRDNWFSKERLESSYPFWIGRTEFSQFSLEGDASRKRHFSISSAGGGCDSERSFFVVSDKDDACPWISEGFKGSVPVLIYNYIQDAPSRVGSGYADRLVVYLM